MELRADSGRGCGVALWTDVAEGCAIVLGVETAECIQRNDVNIQTS